MKEAILSFLRANAPASFTNKEISQKLYFPEPSVRRATLQLEKAAKINLSADSSVSQNLRWTVLA